MMGDVKTIHTGRLDFDIAAREAQVIGTRQRIAPLAPGDIKDEAKALCAQIRKSFGNADPDVIPEIIATMLRHPGLYRCQMEMSIELAARGAIPPRERELAVLRVGWLCRAPYEWGEHVDIAKRYGVTREEIERVTEGSSASGWRDHDRAILRAVEELLGDQSISDETWDVLARGWSEAQLMELPILVGAYYMTALQQNTLKVRLKENSAGLRQR
jgi:alkylhydroperoxidase family enzyme